MLHYQPFVLNISNVSNSTHMPALELGVNIDHIATLRNARGEAYPSLALASTQAISAGADLITLHLREDRRHIKDADVPVIKSITDEHKVRMNLECAITLEMIELACKTKPSDVCLVPEKRQEVTTEGGLDVIAHKKNISQAQQRLQDAGIRTALFIDADIAQIDATLALNIPVIEIHTGGYASCKDLASMQAHHQHLVKCANYAKQQGLEVHAGHGLHYDNVSLIAAIASINELNIGHAIVAHAVFSGWQNAVREMKQLMQQARYFSYLN